ncbi:putative molybdenum cofactor guanylyltransferase [Planctopirus ephydatiae]|uniref:Putative molybdenum cofactor guanylyltransferase n=1 Tax=Planctopirus ephydatiae TaxID=2528019 RepID=A0A518GQA0_9PLAN|nr:molybdenum cofactor guanylyltransferase [Planctopirus ephydatiae]QDV30808.1 putative molybdenum cofactor guanylyltransferase [Planctopirus ephydatiae]
MKDLASHLQRIIILAGGKSSRMGISKANLVFHGETFLERLTRTLSPLGLPIWVLASEAPTSVLSASGKPCSHHVDYDQQSFAGPLMALCGHVSRHPLSPGAWVFVVGCDTPLVDERFVKTLSQIGAARMRDHLDEVEAIGCRLSDSLDLNEMAPFPALISSRFLNSLPQLVKEGERSLFRALRFRPKVVVEGKLILESLADFAAGDLPPWFNVNTPAEYATLTGLTEPL